MWLFLKILGFIFLLGVIFGSQNQVRLALEKARAKLANQPTFVFDSRFLRSISLGHDLLLADLIWLDAVQYIGGHARNMNLDVLYQYLDTVTDLDPRFVYAYQVGELLLPQEGRIDLAVLLARKGMKNNPERWELPFYLGFIYHYYARDYELAAKYYALAARKEGAPLSAQTLAASAQMKGNKHQTGLITWQIILETTDNLALQRLAANRVEREKNLILLEQARQKFKALFNREINQTIDLVTANVLRQLPIDPQGFQYFWDESQQVFELR